MTAFTLLVVLHDSAAELRTLLDSIDRHLDPRPPLVVVDSGSRDDGAALARERGAEVVVLDANRGFGAANNAGIERVTTAVTILLNPDVELLDGSLPALAHRATQRDALVVPRLVNPDGTIQRSAHPVPGSLAGMLLPVPRAAEPWRSGTPRDVGWAIAAALAARTDTLRRLGPFDARAFLHHEDLDLCLRARAAGIPTELRPEVVLRHAGGHATNRSGEPLTEQARRRREVVGANLGRGALARDDLAQAVTFASRALIRGRASRERAQLGALHAARRG